ncbi:MAG: ABC transporter permease [Myxococcales bacterium]
MREVLESIARRPLRSLATAFGVYWGILMLTVLLGGGKGLRNGIEKMFAGDAVNSVWAFTGRTSEPFEGLGSGRQIRLREDDVEAVIRSVDALENVSPRTQVPALPIVHGTRNATLPFYAVYPAYAVTEKTTAIHGRLLNQLDLDRRRKVIVIGDKATPLLFGNDNPVGKIVTIGGLEFRVVGEFEDPGQGDEGRRVYMPYTTLAETFDASRKVDVMVGTLKRGYTPEAAREALARLLARRHRFAIHDHAAFDAWFAEREYRRVESLMTGIDWAILLVSLGTLLSGMVGVSNILFVSVRERAKELGLRRALGATSFSILLLVLAEALMLALVSGGLGLASGMGLVRLAQSPELGSELFVNPSVDLRAALLALAMLVATALVAGFFPAREAARMRPIDALRRE